MPDGLPLWGLNHDSRHCRIYRFSFIYYSQGVTMSRERLAQIYLYFVNNYLTIGKFAEHYGLTEQEAADYLDVCRRCHENPHPEA